MTDRASSATLARALRGAGKVADRADRVFSRLALSRVGLGPGPIASGWATAKVTAVAATAPLTGALVAMRAAEHTATTRQVIDAYPAALQAVLDGDDRAVAPQRVVRLEAGQRWFISSDLHRSVAGFTDWPQAQDTKRLYEAVLDHYGSAEWGLVENGDVEDFWLVGGSTYGALYDVARLAASGVPGSVGAELRHEIYIGHLRRIIENNAGVYERINRWFHDCGRYVRLTGNHDDVYLDERLVEALRDEHEGLEVHEIAVFDDEPSHGVGIATHGHHTDAWNAPGHDWLGKFLTWVASGIIDLPFRSTNPGLPPVDESERLVSGAADDVLTQVDPMFGVNRGYYSVDEVLLFDAFCRQWGDGEGGDLDAGPVFVLGHTHMPLAAPVTPDGSRTWWRYVNSGSGVSNRLLTGVEWDGTHDAHDPAVRLVAWSWADESTDDSTIVTSVDGRSVARQVLQRVPPGRTLSLAEGDG